MPAIDYEALKNKVDRAIEKNDASSLDICYKTTEECKYIQKVAEDKLLRIGIYINRLIFVVAGGITLMVAVDANNDNIFFLKDLKPKLYIIIGAIFGLISTYCLVCNLKPKYNTCSRIILDAEKRLIILDAEEKSIILEAAKKILSEERNP